MFNDNKLIIEKQMIIYDDQTISYYVYKQIIDPMRARLIQIKYPLTTTNLCEVINCLDHKQICKGGPLVMHFPGNRLPILVVIELI